MNRWIHEYITFDSSFRNENYLNIKLPLFNFNFFDITIILQIILTLIGTYTLAISFCIYCDVLNVCPQKALKWLS